jgi:hypothetical protein
MKTCFHTKTIRLTSEIPGTVEVETGKIMVEASLGKKYDALSEKITKAKKD